MAGSCVYMLWPVTYPYTTLKGRALGSCPGSSSKGLLGGVLWGRSGQAGSAETALLSGITGAAAAGIKGSQIGAVGPSDIADCFV